jgi:MFS family permease
VSVRRLRPRFASPLWRNGDFLLLWAGQTISQFGSQVSGLALPLIAILVLNASAFEVAALGVVEFLPFALFSLPAGVWVDRLRRRPILIIADWGRAVALASIPIAYFAADLGLWHLYVVGFLVGGLTVFFDVAYQSYLPALVTREQLVEGNAKLEVSRSGAQVAGPAIAGVLISALTAPYAIVADAVSFVASALCLSRIRRAEPTPAAAERLPMRTEILEGLRYVAGHSILRPSMIYVATNNFFSTLLTSVVLVFAVRELHLSAATVGLTFTLSNFGFLAGALFANRLGLRFGVGPVLVGSAAASGWGLLLIPLATEAVAVAFLATAFFVFTFCAVVYNVTGISLMQAITPDRLLGRMNASRRFVVWGVIPVGMLLGGAIGDNVGLRTAMWVGAVGASVAFVPLLLSPVRSILTMPDESSAEAAARV